MVSLIYSEAYWLLHRKKKTNNTTFIQKEYSLTLIVACRNEEHRLPQLLSSITKQIDDIDQIIIVSDHSHDSTYELLLQFAQTNTKAIVFESLAEGKKNALKEAVTKASSEYIIFTDGDCILPPKYFKATKEFIANNPIDLAIGSVRYTECHSFFEQLQALEFASLQATTAYFTMCNHPIMCNGANLLCRKSIWEAAKEHLHTEQPSGDDIFLLHFVKKIGGKIGYLQSKECIVETFPKTTIKEFFEQRKRWASKSGSYSDRLTIFIACLVLAVNICVAICILLSPIIYSLQIIPAIKILIDTLIILPFLYHIGQIKLARHIIVLSVAYPFYIIYSALGGMLGVAKWKKR